MRRRVSNACSFPMVLALALSASLVFTRDAQAHPFHVSIAEAEWNAETKRLEVALRVAPDDLETALTRDAGKKIRVDESEDGDEAIVAYLNANFILRQSAEDEQEFELHWVGKEVTTKAAWLYFEIDCPEGPEGLHLTNRLLVEVEATQINTVKFKHSQRKATLRFDKKQTSAVIRLEEVKPAE